MANAYNNTFPVPPEIQGCINTAFNHAATLQQLQDTVLNASLKESEREAIGHAMSTVIADLRLQMVRIQSQLTENL